MAASRPPLYAAQKEERKRKKKVNDDVMAIRRERVATLRGRGLTMREIESTLGADTIVVNGEPKKNPNQFLNPETQKPYDLATIQRDCDFLTRQWQKNAEADTAEHRARQLSELYELKRVAWASRNHFLVLSV